MDVSYLFLFGNFKNFDGVGPNQNVLSHVNYSNSFMTDKTLDYVKLMAVSSSLVYFDITLLFCLLTL